jgi:hypothetical protein
MPANDPRKARLIWVRAPSDAGESIRLAVQKKPPDHWWILDASPPWVSTWV